MPSANNFPDLTIWLAEPLVFNGTIRAKIMDDGTISRSIRQRLHRNRVTGERAWFDEYFGDGIAPCC